MNNDRFLTRVFDKQEKKMIYPGDKFNSNHYGNSPYELIGIDSCGLIALDPWKHEINIIPFGDRFIPMQCLGNTDKNKKLIYSADIVATSNNKYLVYREEESAAFWFKRLDNECELLIDDFSHEIEIIGNKWEHPELWEKKQ